MAVQELSWERIPAIIRKDIDDKKARRIALIENVDRKDLNGIEKANSTAAICTDMS
jgi:ParB-like chromosome segregation protein Spo0J